MNQVPMHTPKIQQGKALETKRRRLHRPATRTTNIQIATTKERKPVENPTSNNTMSGRQVGGGGVNTQAGALRTIRLTRKKRYGEAITDLENCGSEGR
ncbi:hypothetical protein C1H46_021254 [Malus baccata]|uniref:Uncharacterized protein n=1 Tax=Malus baccata TaxID=106549 RepID=A0A540M342_MALBA|nr:hypothetical protein C1H46_021254 [Malus baccata]